MIAQNDIWVRARRNGAVALEGSDGFADDSKHLGIPTFNLEIPGQFFSL